MLLVKVVPQHQQYLLEGSVEALLLQLRQLRQREDLEVDLALLLPVLRLHQHLQGGDSLVVVGLELLQNLQTLQLQ